ncbi:MAG: response regulator [Methylobacterium frigidaeris]
MTATDGLRVLVVEDEVFVALELECMLEEAGHSVVGTAASSVEAIALGERLRPELALVDIHLTDGPTGVAVAQALSRLNGIAILFTTANAKRVPEDLAGALGIVAKPYSPRSLLAAVAYAAQVRAGAAPERVPDGLRLTAG